ncbi:MAG TPA: type II toxin-antitoxin system HicB family antitoxin [Ktedonobacterales bacterium]
MTVTYNLFLESGPKRRKTMVHVPDLLGCVATGATTDEALAATPDAIRAYRAFLARHGESIATDAPIETAIIEHITEGDWLGNGSPYIHFRVDLAPLSSGEIGAYLDRVRWLHDDIAEWLTAHAADLDAAPLEGARVTRAIALHVLGASGTYLAAALGGAPGFSRLHTQAERGEVALPDALRQAAQLIADRAISTTKEERAAVRQLSSGSYTMRKALRRMLEHAWEHLAELERRR